MERYMRIFEGKTAYEKTIFLGAFTRSGAFSSLKLPDKQKNIRKLFFE